VPDQLDPHPLDANYRGSEIGMATADHVWKLLELPTQFDNPVVIAGPPTYHDSQAGVVRLRNVGGNSFEIRFQEWSYLDGVHPSENIPYLVLEAGRHTMPDGSVWEVGTLTLDGTGAWKAKTFNQRFAKAPYLFLTVQTEADSESVTVRARNVTTTGFETALFEQQSQMTSGHGAETVGYLAIYSSTLSSTVNIGGANQLSLFQRITLDERWTPLLSSTLKLEEEQSQDTETNHNDETVAVLALGPHLFAQDVSSKDADPVALRRKPPEDPALVEWGAVNSVTQTWITVPLAKAYTKPVVVAKVAQQNDPAPGVVRIRNITPNSFQVRFQEWNYLDGNHGGERIFYLVAEQGQFNLAGLAGQAGKVATNKVVPASQAVTFTQLFNEAPALFVAPLTANNGDAVTVRVKDLTATGFGIAMQEQESKADGHPTETLGWVALQKGTGLTADQRRVRVTAVDATQMPVTVSFATPFKDRFPVLLQDLSSTLDADPATAAQQNLTPVSVGVYVQEEQSADAELDHNAEILSIFAAE